jgi:high-affinity nickel-transport protein
MEFLAGAFGRRCLFLYALMLAGNAAAWAWAFALFGGNPVLIGTAVLAYVLGLRHAVDADHIAAIDNVTRKLTAQGKRPASTGLFFSLGHSTVVALACAVIAMTSVSLHNRFTALREIGGVVGTGISAGFLFVIALANIVTLAGVWRAFHSGSGEIVALPGGPFSRILRPLMAVVARPAQMYPLGFLFGLGFDTASEVGLLGISASQASHAVPLWTIMVFPALFTAGMSLVDTSDGILMTGAYGWAQVRPRRKLAYNFAITLFSILVALIIGVLETLNLIASHFALTGGFWRWVGDINGHSGAIGCAIILTLLSCWALSSLLSRRAPAGAARA